MMHRLFVAFRPPAEILTTLLGIKGGVAGARWQNEAQLHLTLRYIGTVDRTQAEEAAATLESLTFSALTLQLAGVGCFDRKEDARPLWAGVTPVDGLAALHKKIDYALIRVGLEPEHRTYRPHITLARFGKVRGDPGPWIAAHTDLTSAPFVLDNIALFESNPGSEGARYDAIMRVSAQQS
jgi:RNA 2',3'-cyclic 3'-phosphodiesterase